MKLTLIACFLVFALPSFASEFQSKTKRFNTKLNNSRHIISPIDNKASFDIPITYNKRVQKWINYYQGRGKNWLTKIFAKSYRYFPGMQYSLRQKGLPLDLAYIAIIESGLSSQARSHAAAVGYWQFIKSTALRYGLKVDWWIDERKDFYRSTQAAIHYLGDLYDMFGSWYLAASAYNMGENKLKRLIKKYNTKNYWVLSTKRDFPKETSNYVPKLIATLLIAKAPAKYGFYNIKPMKPYRYEVYNVPGGTDLINLARYMGVSPDKIRTLNPGLTKGFVPSFIKSYRIRIPKGSTTKLVRYLKKTS